MTLRNFLRMSTSEFAARLELDEQIFIKIEQGIEEPQSDVLIAIAKIWPEYATYLLTDKVDTKQINPEIEKLAHKLGISGSNDGVMIAQRVYKRWFENHVNQ